MRNMTVIVLTWAGLSVLSGCALPGFYEMNGESLLSLKQATALATTTDDLWHLWEQAPVQEKTVIEETILKAILQGTYRTYERPREELLQDLRNRASSEEIKKTVAEVLRQDQVARQARAEEDKRKQEARALQERQQAEARRLKLQESREQLFRACAGSLDHKSAEDVKRLVDQWNQTESLWELPQEDFPKFFSVGVFYRTFGQPQRKQLISGDTVFSSGHYYFYYPCRDGTVQMEVDAKSLSERDLVFISALNVL